MHNCKQLHLDPGKTAVMVRSGSAAHPSNCTLLWCSAQHSPDLSWEAEVRRPSPDHWQADTLEGICLVQNQRHRSLIFFLCCSIKSFHFHQDFPDCSLSSSISAIGSVLLNPIPLLPLRQLRSPQHFPPTYLRRHQRNRPFTRNILWNQEEHCHSDRLSPRIPQVFLSFPSSSP